MVSVRLCPVISLHIRCFKMVNKQARFQGKVSLLGVNRHDVVVGQGIIIQYGDQFAGGEFGLDLPAHIPQGTTGAIILHRYSRDCRLSG